MSKRVTRNDVVKWLEARATTPAPAPVQTHYRNALRELGYAEGEAIKHNVLRAHAIAARGEGGPGG